MGKFDFKEEELRELTDSELLKTKISSYIMTLRTREETYNIRKKRAEEKNQKFPSSDDVKAIKLLSNMIDDIKSDIIKMGGTEEDILNAEKEAVDTSYIERRKAMLKDLDKKNNEAKIKSEEKESPKDDFKIEYNKEADAEKIIPSKPKVKAKKQETIKSVEKILQEKQKTVEPIEVNENTFDDIDFNKLPNKFVLKCNHASGYNIICKDKDKLDERKTKKQLKKWLKNDYWAMYSEIQYKNIERKIVCEKFLESKGENSIVDYKVYCFNGKADFIMICIGRNTGHIKYYYMDKNWKVMKVNDLGMETPDDFQIEKPKCVDKMFEYAEKLAKPFEFVRVDFYDYKDKPVFGELTFTPAGGLYTSETLVQGKTMAELLDISCLVNKKNKGE